MNIIEAGYYLRNKSRGYRVSKQTAKGKQFDTPLQVAEILQIK